MNGEIAHSANATEPLSRISRSRLDVVWMYFGDNASDDWAAIQEVKTTGQASLDLAEDLINDYKKLFGDDHRVRLQSRLTGLMNVLDELGRGDLSPRLAALGGLGPDSAAGIKLYPTLLHESGIESSTKMLRHPPGNHGARLVLPCNRLLVNWSGPNRPSARTFSSRSIVMPLPSWVDFGTAQQFAAVMSRELSGSSETWATLFSHAQAVLASRTSTRDSEEIDTYDFDEWNDLVCAARILDSAATEKGVNGQGNRTSAAILAACAFGMSGTAVSARAVILGHQLLRSGLSAGELTALALSSPSLSGHVLPELPSGSSYRACVENLSAFLATGGDKEFDMAAKALSDSIRAEGGSWEGVFAEVESPFSRPCAAALYS